MKKILACAAILALCGCETAARRAPEIAIAAPRPAPRVSTLPNFDREPGLKEAIQAGADCSLARAKFYAAASNEPADFIAEAAYQDCYLLHRKIGQIYAESAQRQSGIPFDATESMAVTKPAAIRDIISLVVRFRAMPPPPRKTPRAAPVERQA